MGERHGAYLDANNNFQCSCGCFHSFGEQEGFEQIEVTIRHADCTAWRCPKCGQMHDSRQFHGGLFGFRSTQTVTPVDPRTKRPMVKLYDGEWAYPEDAPWGIDGRRYAW